MTERSSRGPGAERASVTVAVAAAAIAGAPSVFELPRVVAAVGVICVVLLPVLATGLATRRFSIAEPITIVGAMWVLAASLPALFPDLYWGGDYVRDSLPSEVLDAATLWMYRGWSVCAVMYWLARGRQRIVAPALSVPEIRVERCFRILVGVVSLLSTAVFIVHTGGQAYSHLDGYGEVTTLDQIIYICRWCVYVYVFAYFFSRSRGGPARNERWLLTAVLGLQLLVFAATSSKAPMLELIAAWVLGFTAGGARLQFARYGLVAAVGLAAIVVTFQFVATYRDELDRLSLSTDGSVEQAWRHQGEAIGGAWERMRAGTDPLAENDQSTSSVILSRLGHSASFGAVLQVTHGVPPYENSVASLFAPIFAFVPRDLVPGKVTFMDSGDFAQMIGWASGGYSISLPGSFYWAWGYTGVIFGMAAFGGLFGLLARRCDRGGFDELYWRGLLIAYVLSLMEVGGEFQPAVVNLVRMGVLLGVLFAAAREIALHPARPALRLH